MRAVLFALVVAVVSVLRPRASLHLEVLALGHFETARYTLLKDQRDSDWKDVVAEIREAQR
jgi:hypothetical protein